MPGDDNGRESALTLNRKDTGYRGIWRIIACSET